MCRTCFAVWGLLSYDVCGWDLLAILHRNHLCYLGHGQLLRFSDHICYLSLNNNFISWICSSFNQMRLPKQSCTKAINRRLWITSPETHPKDAQGIFWRYVHQEGLAMRQSPGNRWEITQREWQIHSQIRKICRQLDSEKKTKRTLSGWRLVLLTPINIFDFEFTWILV